MRASLPAEIVEGRASPEENGGQATAVRTPSRGVASGQAARQDKTRQDKTRQDKTRQDKTRQDNKVRFPTRSDTQGQLSRPRTYIPKTDKGDLSNAKSNHLRYKIAYIPTTP
jgi:uncharacterized protein YfaP (DUF2135 family)